ncbi:hypothetical protein FNJ84_09550 [Paracoccus sp. M683]|uniref:hypothetical protein n=1 Tax=Paracoccus sp. M683 TaxID=2594268 RepID=UPI00117D65D9|nr:hypothetical protein [Paracoccus sp. M683]TRW97719.1 hypothetical protein FNJ84_09550 [Paracoccus sp. M683]
MTDTTLTLDGADPKRLIYESLRIPGITPDECRSIFVDWALSLPVGVQPADAARLLLDQYAPKVATAGESAHPMLQILVEGARQPSADQPRRRGGRAGRFAE